MKKRTSIEKEMSLKELGNINGGERDHGRCKICGRPHSIKKPYYICRLCLRELHYRGINPKDI